MQKVGEGCKRSTCHNCFMICCFCFFAMFAYAHFALNLDGQALSGSCEFSMSWSSWRFVNLVLKEPFAETTICSAQCALFCQEALRAFKKGEFVMVMDSDDREDMKAEKLFCLS